MKIENLIELFRSGLQEYQNLLNILNAERDSLLFWDVTKIRALTAEKEKILIRIYEWDKHSIEVISGVWPEFFPGESSDFLRNIDFVIEHTERDARLIFISYKNSFVEVFTRILLQNSRNHLLIHQALSVTQNTLRKILQNGDSLELYNSQGTSKTLNNENTILNKQV
jgi:flagellar biosynthesis/type III secretory pathway chaperone